MANWLRERWNNLTLATQFLVAAALVLAAFMATLAGWVDRRIQAGVIQGAAEGAAIYIEGFLEPLIQDLPDTGPLPPRIRQQLDLLMSDRTLRKHVEAMKLWRPDGTLLYSQNPELIGHRFPSHEIALAASGRIASSLEEGKDDDYHRGESMRYPVIEVYVPLHDHKNETVKAIGELYENAVTLERELSRARLDTAAAVGLLSAGMLAILYLIVRRGSLTIAAQRTALQAQFEEATALAEQNAQLRRTADEARLEASRSNEELLGRIGSDLHDGPIQLLGLLMLKLDAARAKEEPGDKSAELTQITSDILVDLRNLSTGLVLPEIHDLSLKDTIRLAVERHKNLTGSDVVLTISGKAVDTPQAVKICAYRVVQEALNNAFHHAHGRDQRVRLTILDSEIRIVVRDGGEGIRPQEAPNDGRARLGLAGLRNRISALNGSLNIRPLPQSGTELQVVLPLQAPGND